ncbi:MAG: phosphatidate cytidylyltransferase [Pseudorhodoplanes sp.]|nr:phosphatidate cytidylyltransferase [Pseudorhodoplanes sp.]
MARRSVTQSDPRSAPNGLDVASNRNLMLRIASAVLLVPLAIGTAYLGGWAFAAFWCVAALAVWWEWTRLLGFGTASPAVVLGFGTLVALAPLVLNGYGPLAWLAAASAAIVIAVLAPQHRVWAGVGMAYAGALLIATLALRQDEIAGFVAILFLFAVVWMTDIFAYFVGRAVGGPKLAPSVSPKKTWSGSIGGVLAAAAAGLAVLRPSGPEAMTKLALIILLLSAVSQAGDLFESRLKRAFHVKDASTLIPGHGGVMDRLDGFMAAVVVAYVLGVVRNGWDAPAQGLVRW